MKFVYVHASGNHQYKNSVVSRIEKLVTTQ
jgi:hypothetical protein